MTFALLMMATYPAIWSEPPTGFDSGDLRATAEVQFSRNPLQPRNRQFGWNCLSQLDTHNKIETKPTLGALSLQHLAAPRKCYTAQNFGPNCDETWSARAA